MEPSSPRKGLHVVIAGEGEIALRLAADLMVGYEVVLIDSGEGDARYDQLDVEVMRGNPGSPEVLRGARVEQASFFVAATTSDERNIVSCAAARQLGAGRTICFLERRGFLAESDDEMQLAKSLGIDHIVLPTQHLADEIARTVTVRSALAVKPLVEDEALLLTFEVADGSPLTEAELKDVEVPPGCLMVIGKRGADYFIPKGDTRFQAGDKVSATCTQAGLGRMNRFAMRRRKKKSQRRSLIVGGGQVGEAVAERLIESGWEVKLLEADRARAEVLAARLDCLVLVGDGTSLSLLQQELAWEIASLVAVTNNDEKNLLISLLAKRLGVPKIITRANRLDNEVIFETVGIDVVISARGAAIRRVVHDIVEDDETKVAELDHGDMRVIGLAVPEAFGARNLSELRPPALHIIGAIVRGAHVIIPQGNQKVQPGDALLIFCAQETEAELKAYFKGEQPAEPSAPSE